MARKTLFAKQSVSGFAPDTIFGGLYAKFFYFPEAGQDSNTVAAFTIEVGETYLVDWDGEEFPVVAQDSGDILPGSVVVGNAADFGLSGNNEPFGILVTDMDVTFVSMIDSKDTHDIAIYQEVADEEPDEPEEPGESIVLKDRNGKDLEYQGIEQLFVKSVSGGTKGFASFKDGELIPGNIAKGVKFGGVSGTMEVPQAVEKSVDLDFSAGGMEVTPESGQVFSKVNIPVPENLAPSVIAEGVNIAGIIGALTAGGGGSIKVETGKVTGNGGRVTAQHSLGVVPDLIFVASANNLNSPNLMGAYGVSAAAYAGVLKGWMQNAYFTKSYFNFYGNSGYTIDGPNITETTVGIIATDTEFSFGNSSYPSANYLAYNWIAIAGLT